MCVERRSIPLWEEGDGLLVAAATPQVRPAADPEFSAAAVVGRCHNPVWSVEFVVKAALVALAGIFAVCPSFRLEVALLIVCLLVATRP